jgi:hypothetical protein
MPTPTDPELLRQLFETLKEDLNRRFDELGARLKVIEEGSVQKSDFERHEKTIDTLRDQTASQGERIATVESAQNSQSWKVAASLATAIISAVAAILIAVFNASG